MTIRVHHPDELAWQQIGDLPKPDWLSDYLDASELGGLIAYHERGSAEAMELLEMRFDPDTVIVPHAHDGDEIVYVIEGSISYGDKQLVAGCSIYISAGTVVSAHSGSTPTRLLSFRARADYSYRIAAPAAS